MSEHKQHEANADAVQRSSQDAKDARPNSPAVAGAAAGPAQESKQMQAPGASVQGAPGPGSGAGMGGAGSMQSVEQFGTGTVRAGGNMLRGAVSTTEELGTGVVGGAAHIATDLVHGVTDLGYEVRNGATGLIGAVGDIGSAVVNTAAGLLVDVVGGVRQVIDAAVHGQPDGRVLQRDRMQARQFADQDRAPAAGRPDQEARH
jgi:hypothetical protein